MVVVKGSAALLATIVVVSILAGAQTASEAEKAIPAREKLSYFEGTWRLELHLKAGPFGSRAFVGTEHNEWMPGRSLLVSRPEGDTAAVSAGLSVMTYNSQDRVYTYHVVMDTGKTEDLRGTLEGHTWTWTSYGAPGEEAPRTRLIIQEISPLSYSLKLETTSEGHEWSTIIEGRAAKIVTHGRQDVAFLR